MVQNTVVVKHTDQQLFLDDDNLLYFHMVFLRHQFINLALLYFQVKSRTNAAIAEKHLAKVPTSLHIVENILDSNLLRVKHVAEHFNVKSTLGVTWRPSTAKKKLLRIYFRFRVCHVIQWSIPTSVMRMRMRTDKYLFLELLKTGLNLQ